MLFHDDLTALSTSFDLHRGACPISSPLEGLITGIVSVEIADNSFPSIIILWDNLSALLIAIYYSLLFQFFAYLSYHRHLQNLLKSILLERYTTGH